MCRFVVLAVPADTDLAGVRRVCEEHGFTPGELPFGIALKCLRGPALYVQPTGSACDCDDVLGGLHDDEDEPAIEREARRLRGRGWSEAKIARRRRDQERARLPQTRARDERLAQWLELLTSLRASLALPWLAVSPQWLGAEGLVGRGDRKVVKVTALASEHLTELRDSDVLVLTQSHVA